ncbi:undecaprenyl-diphosphatase [Glaciihabitans tibetensis]|uniref:Undecaprenyl-diphosphatase n=1 Tax=Glaciihabitans tibetensis TaxID=1266600 RepID=A0A2T0V6Y2_9MICO|nr:phosphatase PAP2 family protein [Glaciihabitans tibetensis]PRY65936.1 undecaprenyl-diphosphatase [Glaciihabitans tibetensis]
MTDNETERDAARVSHRWPLISGAMAVLLVAGLGGIIAIRGNLPSESDAEWMEEIVEHRHPWWELPAMLMNNVGGGLFGVFVVPLLIIAVLCFYRRFVSALYFFTATVSSAALVQLLKNLYDRPRPEEILVVSDVGSFPSGHSANAATMAVVLGFIIRRLWVWVAGIIYTVVMVLSRTYLGAHWLSDTVGGVVLGAAVAVIIWAPFAYRLHQERKSPPRPLIGRRTRAQLQR